MKLRRLLLLKFALLFLAFNVSAQSFDVTLRGTITDEFGALIPVAEVKATSKNGKIYSALTDSKGEFELKLVEDLYKIEVIKSPFNKFEVAKYFVGRTNMNFDASLQCEGCEILNCPNIDFSSDKSIETYDSKVSTRIFNRPLLNSTKENKRKKKGN